jgi:hypothetical protein
MPVWCEHNIVKLQISVKDAVLMKIFKGNANLGGIEPENKLRNKQGRY